MSIFQTLQNTTTATGETEAQRRAAETSFAAEFTARSGATEPTGDLLAPSQQRALDGIVADLADRGVTLRGYQHAAVETAVNYRRVVLGFAPGLGKTLTALTTWATEKALGTPGALLVVCPPHLRLNWQGEVSKYFPGLTVAHVTGNKPAPVPSADVVIVPDSVISRRTPDLVEAITDGTITAAVFDESQRFKSNRFQTKRSHAALLISHHLHNVRHDAVIMSATGTLVANYPSDVLQPVALCGPGVTRRLSGSGQWDPEIGCVGYNSFLYRWAVTTTKQVGGGREVTEVIGCKDYPALNAELRAAAYIWVDRYEVTDLDPVTWLSQTTDCSAHLSTYREVEQNFLSWIERELGPAAMERATKAQVLVQLNHLRKHEGLAKVSAALAEVEDLIQQGEQVVIFADHRAVVEAMTAALFKAKVPVEQIVGGMSAKAKREAQQRFQNGDAQVIVCNYEAASTGIDLDSPTSRTVLLLQLPWTPSTLVQAAGRVERLTQTRSCFVVVPLATDGGSPTVGQRMWAVLESKVRTADAVNNGGESDTLANHDDLGAGSAASAVMASYGCEWD